MSKIQGSDVKTVADVGMGNESRLPNDTQIWVTATGINKTLDQAITDGDIGGGGGSGLTWSIVTVNTSAAINNGYITNSASRVEVTLPATAAVGDIVAIVGQGAGGWQLKPSVGQTIKNDSNNLNTTSPINSGSAITAMELICTVANTTWVGRSLDGSATSGPIAGYYLTGSTAGGGAEVDNINKLTFATETRTVLTATVSQIRQNAAGVSGPLAGYMAGGTVGAGRLTSIEKLTFATDARTNIAATLDTAKNAIFSAGVYSTTKGYIAGGNTISVVQNVIEDMDFSSETSATIAAVLSADSSEIMSASSATKGYWAGGDNPLVNLIRAFTFSSETRTNLAATISANKGYGSGCQSAANGYFWGGGPPTPRTNVIDRLVFSTEVRTTLAATLPTAVIHNVGTSSSDKGYSMGGDIGGTTNVISALTFSGETTSTIAATLNQAKNTGTGMQG